MYVDETRKELTPGMTYPFNSKPWKELLMNRCIICGVFVCALAILAAAIPGAAQNIDAKE